VILIQGSSKDFYQTADPRVLKVIFKDVVHGRGRASTIPGTGRLREEFCFYFYQFLEKQGVKTQLAKSISGQKLSGNDALLPQGILVEHLSMIPLEWIVRYVARGHWVDSHKVPLFPQGISFHQPIVECCLKWKQAADNLSYQHLGPMKRTLWRMMQHLGLSDIVLPEKMVVDDPRVTFDIVRALHHHASEPSFRGKLIDTQETWHDLQTIALRVNEYLREFLNSQGWILEDGKFEMGWNNTGEIVVGDEYTQDSSRIRNQANESLTKDLYRDKKPDQLIYESYAKLTEAMKAYAA